MNELMESPEVDDTLETEEEDEERVNFSSSRVSTNDSNELE